MSAHLTRTVTFTVDDVEGFVARTGSDDVAGQLRALVDRELGFHVMAGMSPLMRGVRIHVEAEEQIDTNPMKVLVELYHTTLCPTISDGDQFYFALLAKTYADVVRTGNPILMISRATGRPAPTVKMHLNSARDRGYLTRPAHTGVAEGQLTDRGARVLDGRT